MQSYSAWKRFLDWYLQIPKLGMTLDISRMGFNETWWNSMQKPMEESLHHMYQLEKGSIANPDEKRMVGHYWLRDPKRAVEKELKDKISSTLAKILSFSKRILAGETASPGKKPFQNLLLIGIGGSSLGPRLVYNALEEPHNKGLKTFFFDNTDPAGMDRIFGELGDECPVTLVLVISKSGTTPETRNGMLETRNVFKLKGLDFTKHAIAVTVEGSLLEKKAIQEKWLEIFPMWDWVGGRTSLTSAAGLLPAALQGLDIVSFLEGAREMDQLTRGKIIKNNPASLLALMWHFAGEGKGGRAMVVLPYKDSLEILGRYLQQLLMESLGKEKDLEGNSVEQGLTVYGNKGSTDQHAYIQQLRDGRSDFFVLFIEILNERKNQRFEMKDGLSSGDFLQGFLLGTREALSEKKRPSMLLSIEDIDPFRLGALIALFERAVGLYAALIGINAYHQPGVEAGKKAADHILTMKSSMLGILRGKPGKSFTVEDLKNRIGHDADEEIIFRMLEHLRVNQLVESNMDQQPNLRKYNIKHDG